MARFRRMAPVVLSVMVVLATGALGLALTARANSRADQVLVKERVTLQSTIAGLGKQFVLFSIKEASDYASSQSWQLTPGSAADQQRLAAFVGHATFLAYGADLVTPGGQLLDSYSTGVTLPSLGSPGYAPLRRALLAGEPDVSDVMEAGPVALVAMGAPVEVGGQVKAVLVGFMSLRHSTLETDVEQLHYGPTSEPYVVDSSGTIVAAHDPSLIGTRLAQPRALASAARGRSGSYQDAAAGTEVTYAPFGAGGWVGVTVQKASVFFGLIRSSDLQIGLALLAVLGVASVLIVVLGERQQAVRRRYQELLVYAAHHDALTGLANRSLLHTRLDQALARARRQRRGVALMYLDLDRFKPVNDRIGHEAGDELLVALAERLVRTVRTEDLVARIGGDEFAVVMEDVDDPVSARQAAERIVTEVGRPVSVRGHEVVVGVSIGVAYSPQGEDPGESLLRDADLAMYRAKDAGKSGYVFAGAPLGAREL